jgi:two-component system, sensor histidine kinase
MDKLLSHLWDGDGFMPHGMCYLWQPGILTLHVASDALIAAAYFSIPFTLAHFVRKRKDIEFNFIIACFAIFIIACGATHLLEIVTIWHPAYWVSGAVKAVTAAASVPTALLLVKLMPQALRWPSPDSLQRANEELQLANRHLLEARDAADRANRAKGRFVATASHDLRQPLQTLSLLNGSLQRLVSSPEAMNAVAEQEQAIGTMSRMLNALLDIGKLESGAVEPQVCDFALASLFEELRIEFSELAQKKGVELEIALPTAVARSDRTLLGQILRNLLSNAIRYTPRGVVRVHAAREDERLCIDVEDSGIGIARDQLAAIFEDFYQVGVAPNSVREGYGLGLGIVERAAQLLNHDLQVRSEPGRGSTFSILVPAGTASGVEAVPGRTISAAARARRPHVLIVDDDASVLKAIRRFLQLDGFPVSSAASVSEATQLAGNQPDIELLVTDFHLTNGEVGTDVIAAIRGITGRPVRAVVISGDTSLALRKVTLQDPHVRLASKPVNAAELLSLIAELLES